MAKHITVLDVGFTHCVEHYTYDKTGETYKCPMRLAQHPTGYWYCIDCGMAIVCKNVEIRTYKPCPDCKTIEEQDACNTCGGTGKVEE
jgi:hypothetical protein